MRNIIWSYPDILHYTETWHTSPGKHSHQFWFSMLFFVFELGPGTGQTDRWVRPVMRFIRTISSVAWKASSAYQYALLPVDLLLTYWSSRLKALAVNRSTRLWLYASWIGKLYKFIKIQPSVISFVDFYSFISVNWLNDDFRKRGHVVLRPVNSEVTADELYKFGLFRNSYVRADCGWPLLFGRSVVFYLALPLAVLAPRIAHTMNQLSPSDRILSNVYPVHWNMLSIHDVLVCLFLILVTEMQNI